MWTTLLASGGIGAGAALVLGLARLAYQLHQDAVAAERARADDARTDKGEWRAAAEAASKRADVRDEQLATLMAAVAAKRPDRSTELAS